MFDHTSVSLESLDALTAATIAAGEKLVNEVVSAPNRTFTSTMLPLESIARLVAEAYGEGPFAAQVHSDAAVRDAARASEERLTKWSLDLAYRDDLYDAVRAYAETPEANALTGEERRFLEFTLRDFRLAGQELPSETRDAIQKMRQRLVELELAFATNLAEYEDQLEVTRDDLAGMPEAYIESLAEGSQPGTLAITMDYPDVLPFFDQSPRRDLREQLAAKFNSIAVDTNGPILRDAIRLRADVAAAFGHDSWADYRMQEKMAKTPGAVAEFYDSLVPALTAAAANERAEMAALLAADGHEGDVQAWDRRYYHTRILQERYGVDPAEVAAYFPLDQVVKGLFEITQSVFGLRYRLVETTQAWHEDANLYEVRDATDNSLLAFFYMDLFPREGKFSHAAAFPLVPATVDTDGTRAVPVSAILANLTKPAAGRPSLLRHEEVVTVFHEFGHILHMSLSRARFTRFSAASTEWDFVEAPSQIMENWCWDASVLGRFARHHETGEPIPTELVTRLTDARNLNVALFNLRQIFLGQIDLDVHNTLDVPDPLEVEITRAVLTTFAHQPGTFIMPSFGHLLGGYDAGYYGYLWAQVYGQDMFTAFSDRDILSSDVGMRYRRDILEPNGTIDAADLVVRFLGRDPSNQAFLQHLGIA